MSRRQADVFEVVCDGCGIVLGEEPEAEGRVWFAAEMKPGDYDAPDDLGWLIDAPGDWCARCKVYDEERDEFGPPPPPGAVTEGGAP